MSRDYDDLMTEIITTAALEAASNDAQGVITRLFGPTADIMGSQMAEAYKKKLIKRVINKADKKAKTDRIGSIPPRVVQEVFEKAQWSENQFVAEYLSGVLASSRSDDGTNDNGMSWTAIVGRLPSDQLALHWLIYSSTQKRAHGESCEDIWGLLREQQVWDITKIFCALGWELSEESVMGRFYEALYGLRREGLVTDLSHGQGDYLNEGITWTAGGSFDPEIHYATFKLTNDGIGLLLQSLGLGGSWYSEFLSPETSYIIDAQDEMPKSVDVKFVRDFPKIDAGK